MSTRSREPSSTWLSAESVGIDSRQASSAGQARGVKRHGSKKRARFGWAHHAIARVIGASRYADSASALLSIVY